MSGELTEKMTDDERAAVAAWAEKNENTSHVARAFWALMPAMEALEEVNKAMDSECTTLGEEGIPDDAFCAAIYALEAVEDAWYDAREALGHRCLIEMGLANAKVSGAGAASDGLPG